MTEQFNPNILTMLYNYYQIDETFDSKNWEHIIKREEKKVGNENNSMLKALKHLYNHYKTGSEYLLNLVQYEIQVHIHSSSEMY